MPKLSVTLPAAALWITLAPAANAYAVDPGTGVYVQPAVILSEPEPQVAQDTCAVALAPQLAQILNLPEDWQEDEDRPASTLACAD